MVLRCPTDLGWIKKKGSSPEEAHRFLAAAKDNRLYALYVLAVTTGLRRGEMLALRWQDIDLKAGTLAVRRTLVDLNGKLGRGEPKTIKGSAVSCFRQTRRKPRRSIVRPCSLRATTEKGSSVIPMAA